MNDIQSCKIEQLFDTMASNIFIDGDKRYIGELPNLELEYYDENTKTIKWGGVEYIEKHLVDKPMFEVSLSNGFKIKVTEDHSLMVVRKGELIESKVYEIEDNDVFITVNGNTILENITPLERQAEWVYDIQMKDTPHTFFANGVLVHNSCFLKYNVDVEKLTKVVEELNKTKLKKELIQKYNPDLDDDYLLYDLEWEKTLKYIYFGDKKKRYYSIQEDDSKYIHGLNIIRKDTPEYVSELLDNLCEKSVKQNISVKDLEETYELIQKADYDQIAVHKSFSKRFESYNKTMPQHVSGALFANEHLNLSIRHSDVVFLFYINSFCEPDIKPKDRKNVVCLRREDFPIIKETDKFEIDYMELMEKQFIQPLREFDKIPVVAKAIEDWAIKYSDNYRLSKVNGYVFKKRKI